MRRLRIEAGVPAKRRRRAAKHRRRRERAAAVGGAVVALFPQVAGAQSVTDPVEVLGTQVNLLWVVIGAVLVIFMQAGFALVETGFCRAKHAAHVFSTNFAVFGLGFVGYFLFGYAFMFGGYSYPLPGYDFGYNLPVGDALIGSGSPDQRFNWSMARDSGISIASVTSAGGAGSTFSDTSRIGPRMPSDPQASRETS